MKKTTVKTSVSLSGQVADFAQELMRKWGYDNFSAFVAELIRREKMRDEERAAAMRGPPIYPPPNQERVVLREKPSKN